MSPLRQDLSFAARSLWRAPGFTATAVLTLAVGMAGALTMFTIVQGILLRPLPVADEARLFVGWQSQAVADARRWPFRDDDLAFLRRESRLLDVVAGVGYNDPGPKPLAERGSDAVFVQCSRVTGEFFEALGVAPLLGRTLQPSDNLTGAENVLVIAHALWQRRYGGSRDVLGARVSIDHQPFTIVGVMPPDVEYPRHVEAWMTVTAMQTTAANEAFRAAVARELNLLARLRPGVTAEQATAELGALAPRLEAERPAGGLRGVVPTIQPYKEAVVGDARTALATLVAAVGLVLLIACANAANLLLLRGESRGAELAVRTALGAARGRIVGQLLVETALLVVMAAVLAMGLTVALVPTLAAWLPAGLPRLDAVRVDAGVALVSVVLVLAITGLAGVAPALATTRVDLMRFVRGAGPGQAGPGFRRGRRVLVVVQVALAVTTVTAALLLVRTLQELHELGARLEADRMMHVPLALPPARYAERDPRWRFMTELTERLSAQPGVTGATPVNAVPFSGIGWDVPTFTAEGQSAEAAAANGTLNFEEVHPQHFRTLGIALMRGRGFTVDDRSGAPLVAIITEDAAARTWPGQDPLGKRVKLGGLESQAEWRTIVGVAIPTRFRSLTGATPSLYVPAAQLIAAAHDIIVRTSLPPSSVAVLVREQIRAVDADVQVMPLRRFGDLLDVPLARPRVHAGLSALFGVTGLALAAIGLYAVIAAGVRERSREIGIRVAMGATPHDVRRLVLVDAGRLVGAGALPGLVLALASTRLLRGLLVEVQPLDPLALAVTIALLLTVAGLALYVPVRRASRLDPMSMLRTE